MDKNRYLGVHMKLLDNPIATPEQLQVESDAIRIFGIVITSYSIHYTKLYDAKGMDSA